MGAENRSVDPFDLNQEPELAELLKTVSRNIKLAIRTHVPASVVVYDPARQVATVTVGQLTVVKVKDITKLPTALVSLKGTPPNAEATLAPILLVDIPVAWPRTKAGYITFPMVPGDTGELHVHDRALEAWKVGGLPSDPVLAFTHALKDSVFHPGLAPTTAPIIPPTDILETVVNGTIGVKIGALAISHITKAEELTIAIDAAIVAAIAAGAGTPGSGAAAFTAFQTSWNAAKATILAVKSKAE